MNATVTRIVFVAAVFGLACTASGQCQETRSVSWFMQHPDKMTSRSRWCRHHPDHNDMDCVNAMIACSKTIDPTSGDLPACATTRPMPEEE